MSSPQPRIDFSEPAIRRRVDVFAGVLRTEIRRYWDDQQVFRTSEFQHEMADELVPPGSRMTSEFFAATWTFFPEMRDAFLLVIPEFCPHVVRISINRFPPLTDVTEWLAEQCHGKMGYVSAHNGFMHYFFSDPDDAFAFKLTFA